MPGPSADTVVIRQWSSESARPRRPRYPSPRGHLTLPNRNDSSPSARRASRGLGGNLFAEMTVTHSAAGPLHITGALFQPVSLLRTRALHRPSSALDAYHARLPGARVRRISCVKSECLIGPGKRRKLPRITQAHRHRTMGARRPVACARPNLSLPGQLHFDL